MKTLVATVLLALIASSAASHWTNFRDAFISGIRPYAIQTHEGQDVQVFSVNVTVPGLTRAAAAGQTVSFYATSLVDSFLSGYTFCKTKRWELASPKSEEEQAALEAVIAQFNFPGNAWLGSICQNNRWVWLSDDSFVNYNKFPTVGGAISPVPPCETSIFSGLMIFGNSFSNFGRWFKWGAEFHTEVNHVICQG